MSKIRAIRDFSNANPGLHVVGNVIPGSRNFPQAVLRMFSLACVLAFIAGAYQLIGGNWKDLWQVKPFVALIGLTFVLATRQIGFRTTLTGFTSAVFGPAPARDPGLDTFNDHAGKWALTAAHIFCIMNVFHALPTLGNLGQFGMNIMPAIVGYIYAGVLAVALPGREDKKGGLRIVDVLMPAICLAATYYLVMHVMK